MTLTGNRLPTHNTSFVSNKYMQPIDLRARRCRDSLKNRATLGTRGGRFSYANASGLVSLPLQREKRIIKTRDTERKRRKPSPPPPLRIGHSPRVHNLSRSSRRRVYARRGPRGRIFVHSVEITLGYAHVYICIYRNPFLCEHEQAQG